MPVSDFMMAVQVAQHPPASHDELLARRHAQRAPRVSSLDEKPTSSFLPANGHTPHDASPILSFMMAVQVVCADYRIVAQHPPASHDEFLARRHAQRAPRVSSLDEKPTSAFLPATGRAPNDAFSILASCVPTSATSASQDEFLQLALRSSQREPCVAPALHTLDHKMP
jgi:hypothetical protein